MHIYNSKTGLFRFSDGTCSVGYSGHGLGVNNPALEAVRGEGPIPVGIWDIFSPRDDTRLGPYAMPLEPIGHTAHGRSGFYIHGDNKDVSHSASHGCIILSPQALRRKIWQSGIHILEVISE